MVSFIITAKDKQKRITYAQEMCAKQHIDQFDITLLEKDTSVKTTQSIGIDEVKNMQKKIFFKPMKSAYKAVIIEDAHLLTTEAQNALLKVLEEPPANTIIILGADTKEALLPTIHSRCQIIELEADALKLTEKQKSDLTEFIANLPELPIGGRLKKAELLAKDKDKAIAWVEKVLLVLREQTINSVILSEVQQSREGTETVLDSARTIKYVSMLKSFQQLHTALKTTNTNPRFAIEHTLLQA